MAQRRHHYERAFEGYLRDQRVPYMAVNEARRALLPKQAKLELIDTEKGPGGEKSAIKNFDFVVYGDPADDSVAGLGADNLLVEVKGRRLPRMRLADGRPAKARLESWVTMDDVEAMGTWERLFGEGYRGVFVFVYWCDDVPPDGLFAEVFEYQGRWYTVRAVTLEDYEGCMKVRSPKWRTVNLSAADYERVWRGVCPANGAGLSGSHLFGVGAAI
ncbi:MAG: HYExAFE family protein [Phycisphaerales bacterium]